MVISQKIRFYPNNELKDRIWKLFGASRWAFNKGIEVWEEQYQRYKNDRQSFKYPNAWKVRDELKENLPSWWNNVSLMILETACDDLERAHRGSRKPNIKFRSRKDVKQSCRFYKKNESNFQIFDERYLQLPSLYKRVRKISPRGKVSYKKEFLKLHLTEKPKYPIEKVQEVSLSFDGQNYYCSLIFRIENCKKRKKTNKTIGVDLGLKDFATYAFDNDNQTVEFSKVKGPKEEIKRLEKKIENISKKLSNIELIHKKKNEDHHTSHWKRLNSSRRRLYERIKNIKSDFINKQVYFLAKNFGKITIETLNSSGMIKNHKLARAIQRYSFYEFKMKLQNKVSQFGKELVLADIFYPSTQLCSSCGYRKSKATNDKMKLKDRVYICPKCGLEIDRDENAAYNLKLYDAR